MATVGTNVIYAGIHQSGGKINIPARSQQAYYRQNKDGTLNNKFARKSKANYSEWNTIPAYEINMPARPFLSDRIRRQRYGRKIGGLFQPDLPVTLKTENAL
jgi:phage gpG-like protein